MITQQTVYIVWTALSVVLIVLGVGLCGWGYRKRRFFVGAFLFVLAGAALGAVVVETSKDQGLAWLSAIVGGVLCVTLFSVFRFFYKVGIFCAGGFWLGLVSTLVSLISTGNPLRPEIFFTIVGGGGLFAAIFERASVIVGTSLTGGWTLTLGGTYFASNNLRTTLLSVRQPEMLSSLFKSGEASSLLLLAILTAILGCIIQHKFTAKELLHSFNLQTGEWR